MKVMITKESLIWADTVFFDLPNSALSLHGAPMSFDQLGRPYITLERYEDFPSERAASDAYKRMAEDFVPEFLSQLPENCAAVEWRVPPVYEIREKDDVWRGMVRCRFTAHTELPS